MEVEEYLDRIDNKLDKILEDLKEKEKPKSDTEEKIREAMG